MDGHNHYYSHHPNPSPRRAAEQPLGPAPPAKRRRGRPRKYGPDGTVTLALSPLSSPVPGSGSASDGQKRRGRPPGSGRKQQLALLGEWVFGSAGMGFTPHVIKISEGEDIAAKIMSFSQQGPRAVCILSANGVVSTVTLRQPETSAGTVTYEGRFEILCLSGSYVLTDDGGSLGRSGGLSISLSSPDGRVVGGGVGGQLVAASTVQIIVGSFIYGGSKGKTAKESNVSSEHQTSDRQMITPCSTLPGRGHTDSPVTGGWPGLREIVLQSPHLNIDLMHG